LINFEQGVNQNDFLNNRCSVGKKVSKEWYCGFSYRVPNSEVELGYADVLLIAADKTVFNKDRVEGLVSKNWKLNKRKDLVEKN